MINSYYFLGKSINTLVLKSFRYKCTKATNKHEDSSKYLMKRVLGQPSPNSHGHLLQKDEVLPEITASELQGRREKLYESIVKDALKKYPTNSNNIIVVPSASKQFMSEKIPYVFRQNSDYLYLSGCQEPDTCLVITSGSSPSQFETTLFVREKDAHAELWDGPRTSPVDAINFFGVDRALPINEFRSFLKGHIQPSKPATLWYDFTCPTQVHVQKEMKDYLSNNASNKVWDIPKPYIHKLRLFKSKAEINLMKKSCEIGSKSILECMNISQPGITEHQLLAQVEYHSKMAGAEILAYPPVIAGGNRATTIHYINNNQVINDHELVLMDAGCEYHGYTSDITRTWPINGSFSPIQKEMYEMLLYVQTELINSLHKCPSLDEILNYMYLILGRGLKEIGFQGKSGETVGHLAYEFCPHHVSHYLGMDVHDTPSVSRNIPLQPSMIITIEPGIYINKKHNVPKELHGIGMRIEDDVLITENGPVVLSNCPKTIDEIEKEMNNF